MRKPHIHLPRLRWPRRRHEMRGTHYRKQPPVRILRAPRRAALVTIAVLVAAASLVSFAESYRGLYEWAREHDLYGQWAYAWPVQVDTFIAVGELALFVALVDAWSSRSRIAAWIVTGIGLAVSVAGNVGHITVHSPADKVTAAVPPVAAAAALAVGLGVLKRIVEHHGETVQDEISEDPHIPAGNGSSTDSGDKVPSSSFEAARHRLEFATAHGFKIADSDLRADFGLTRSEATKIRTEVLAMTNGHGGNDSSGRDSPDG